MEIGRFFVRYVATAPRSGAIYVAHSVSCNGVNLGCVGVLMGVRGGCDEARNGTGGGSFVS